ncbi:MAG: response regulator [Sulfuricella sp.]|nr:response regulator [Sulfuricella sp.]
MFTSDSIFENRRFLIVDDFQGMRAMLREMLKAFGSRTISVAANAKEAIAYLEQSDKYDAVLCDYNIGPGKNGQQVLEEAKYRHLIGPATAWVIVTAEKTSDMVIGAAEYMPDDYIIKPINEAALRSRLEKVITKKAELYDIQKAIFAKNFNAALSLCDKAMGPGKANNEILRIKSNLLLDIGRYDKAKELFEKILSVRDVPWAKTGLAKVAFHMGEMETAQRLLKEVINESRSYMEAHDWLAKTYHQRGDLEEAQRILVRCTETSPNSMNRQKTLGEIAHKRGDLDVAEKAFRKTIKLGENSILNTPVAHLGLAKICTEKDNPSEALQLLKSVHKEFDDKAASLHAKVMEGVVYQKTGDHVNARKAAEELAAIIQEDPNLASTDVALEAAGFLFKAGDKEAAQSMLETVVKNNHDDDALIDQVKEIFDQAGMENESRQMIDTSRREVVETNNKGVTLAKEGQLDEAIQWLRNAKAMLPNNKQILLNFTHAAILAMQKNGRNDNLMSEAKECLNRVGALDPLEKRRIQYLGMLEAIPSR